MTVGFWKRKHRNFN